MPYFGLMQALNAENMQIIVNHFDSDSCGRLNRAMAHVGRKIIELRDRMGLTQDGLAIKAGVSRSLIQKSEAAAERYAGRPRFKRIADALGQPPEAIDPEWHNMADGDEPPEGIESTMTSVPVIPTWDIEVRASHWASVPICAMDLNDPDQEAVVRFGRFRLRILGDCMEPVYADGSVVEFEIMRVGKEGMEVQHDYVFCKNDGTATFKRLIAQDEDAFTLAAINQRKYPGTFSAPLQEVCRTARVLGIISQPPQMTVKPRRPKKA